VKNYVQRERNGLEDPKSVHMGSALTVDMTPIRANIAAHSNELDKYERARPKTFEISLQCDLYELRR
jgi:hypothetical protein